MHPQPPEAAAQTSHRLSKTCFEHRPTGCDHQPRPHHVPTSTPTTLCRRSPRSLTGQRSTAAKKPGAGQGAWGVYRGKGNFRRRGLLTSARVMERRKTPTVSTPTIFLQLIHLNGSYAWTYLAYLTPAHLAVQAGTRQNTHSRQTDDVDPQRVQVPSDRQSPPHVNCSSSLRL